ncbi:MAG: glycosyltransferase [Microcystaceae cyanobacterium]
MPNLSLCMIVQNEAANLPQCLESVKGWVTEMVILDTGSQDNTVAIAQGYGATVIAGQWSEDFSQARNEALKAVSGDWVLVLDADERLNPKMQERIHQAIANDQTLVINLLRQEIGASQSPYSSVSRLFRRHPQIYFNRPYHETIDDSVLALLKQEPQWQILDLPGVAILHSGYRPDVIQEREKTQRAEKLLEKALAANPQDAYLCSKLGALYLQLGKEKEGLKLLKQGLKSNLAQAPVRFELHYHLANAYNRQNKGELALKHYTKAINEPILLPLKLGALNNLGALYHQQGNLPEAQKVCETVIQIDPTLAVGYYNLGMVYKSQNRLLEAIKAYQKAIELNPQSAAAHQNLGVATFKAGLLPESLTAFKTAIALYEQQQNPEADKLRKSLEEMGMI